MRLMIIGGLVTAALLATPITASAQAQNEAYCATMKGTDNAAKMNCSYKTMSECEAAVKSGQGTCAKNSKK